MPVAQNVVRVNLGELYGSFSEPLVLRLPDIPANELEEISYGPGKNAARVALATGAGLIYLWLNVENLESTIQTINDVVSSIDLTGVSTEVTQEDLGSVKTTLDDLLNQQQIKVESTSERDIVSQVEKTLDKLFDDRLKKIAKTYVSVAPAAHALNELFRADIAKKTILLHRLAVSGEQLFLSIKDCFEASSERQFSKALNNADVKIDKLRKCLGDILTDLEESGEKIVTEIRRQYSDEPETESLVKSEVITLYKNIYEDLGKLYNISFESVIEIAQAIKETSQDIEKFFDGLVRIAAASLLMFVAVVPELKNIGKRSDGRWWKIVRISLLVMVAILALIALRECTKSSDNDGEAPLETDQQTADEPSEIDAENLDTSEENGDDVASPYQYSRTNLEDLGGVIDMDAPTNAGFFVLATEKGATVYEPDGSIRTKLSPFNGRASRDRYGDQARLVADLQGPMALGAAASPDGQLIALTGSLDRKTVVYNLQTRRFVSETENPYLAPDERTRFNYSNGLVGHLVFSPDGGNLLGTNGATHHRGASIRLWDLQQSKQHDVDLPDRRWFGTATAFSNDGTLAFIAAHPREKASDELPTLFVYEATGGLSLKNEFELTGIEGEWPVSIVALNDKAIAVLTYQGSLVTLDLQSGQVLQVSSQFNSVGLKLLYDVNNSNLVMQGCDTKECYIRTSSVDGSFLKEWPVWPNQPDKRAMGWIFLKPNGELVTFDPAQFNLLTINAAD